MENKKFFFYVNLTPEDVFTALQTSAAGLSQVEAQRRYLLYGSNEIAVRSVPWFTIAKNQVTNLFIVMLIIIAIIYFCTAQYAEAMVLMGIIAVNISVGFYQEYKNNKAMTLLRSYVHGFVAVKYAGVQTTTTNDVLVSGDVIVLRVGDVVPADCRIIEGEGLVVDESGLTGESVPVEKTLKLIDQSIDSIDKAYNCCFAGTTIIDGVATAVVFATGSDTELGAIALLTADTAPKSNLARGTMHLAHMVLFFVLVSLVLVFFINVFVERELSSWLDFLIFSAALGISAIPSVLPTVITFCLSKGAIALHKHEIVVKRLSVIEDLGSIEIFCTDFDSFGSTAHSAIEKAQALGVQIKILSSDNSDDCFARAQELGLEVNRDHVIDGKVFESSSQEHKMFLVHNRTVFAGVTAEQKYQIVAYLQKKYSVAYRGDGIDDAPALRIAHVGITAHDAAPVAREVAEVVILKNSLLNIMLGIQEGRKVVINTLKYITITISSNLGNFYSLAFSSLLINYLPMLPLQLLFLNLVADFPLIAISTDAVSSDEIKKPVRYSTKDIFVTLLFGLISSPFDFLIFVLFRHHPATLQTSWFIASALGQLALIFSLRTKQLFWRSPRPSAALSLLSLLAVIIIIVLPFTNFGQKTFLFVQPKLIDLLKIGAIVIAYFLTTETVKIFYYRSQSSK